MKKLLRAHIRGRAHEGAGVGGAFRRVHVLRDSEVENSHEELTLFLAEKDIRRLHVTVDDADLVRLAEPSAQLNQDGDLVSLQPELRVSEEPRSEGLALHELHHDVRECLRAWWRSRKSVRRAGS